MAKKGKHKEHKVLKDSLQLLLDGRLVVFKAVKGLVRDGDYAEALVRELRPGIVALGVAPEDLKGLRQLRKRLEEKKKYSPQLTNIDWAFAEQLSKYGDVDAPPPCFVRALDTADELKIPVASLDMDNEAHTEVYVSSVDLSDLLRQSFRFRWIKKKKFGINTPEEFVLTWDKTLNKAKGFRVVEKSREVCMGETLRHLLDKHRDTKVLAIIEIERASGVLEWAMRTKKNGSKTKG